MLELLLKIDEVNGQLLSLLNSNISNDNYIDELNNLLDIRESLIKDVRQTQTPAEKHLADKIIKDNEQINELLKQGTLQIKREINQFYLKKKNNQRYDNPYQDTHSDGIFIDKKN